MTIKTDIKAIHSDAQLVGNLADPQTHQPKILMIIGFSAYAAYGYAAYRLIRGGLKLALRSK